MKITDRFVGDHKSFRKLIKEIDLLAASETPDQRRLVHLVEILSDHLMLHDWGERTFYYPAVAAKAGAPPLTRDYMRLLDDEHASIDGVIERMETEVKEDWPAERWKYSYEEFKKGLTAHMKKEEEELFPLSEKLLGVPALEEISAQIEKRRSEAPRVRHHAPLEETRNA